MSEHVPSIRWDRIDAARPRGGGGRTAGVLPARCHQSGLSASPNLRTFEPWNLGTLEPSYLRTLANVYGRIAAMTQVHRSAVVAVALLASRVMMPAAAGAQSEPFKVFDTRPVITQGPYLVATSGTTATIVWFTDAPSHSKVRYGTAAPLTQIAEPQVDGLVPVGLRHVVTLTGLTPGTTYSYQAISTRVVRLNAYWPDKGLDVESAVLPFTTLDPAKSRKLLEPRNPPPQIQCPVTG